jgi:hypothetical protein
MDRGQSGRAYQLRQHAGPAFQRHLTACLAAVNNTDHTYFNAVIVPMPHLTDAVKYPECNLINGGLVMRNTTWLRVLTTAALVTLSSVSLAQSTISYGLITAVRATTVSNPQAQTAGALVGGTIGLASGSGQSSSNRALRTVGGGLAGRQVARIAMGWRLKPVSEPVIICTHAQTPEAILAPKQIPSADLQRCEELGQSLATGLALGIF